MVQFHFGGSTHLQIFRNETKLEFRPEAQVWDLAHTQGNLPVKGYLARVAN